MQTDIVEEITITTVLKLKKPMTEKELSKIVDESAPLEIQKSLENTFEYSTESITWVKRSP